MSAGTTRRSMRVAVVAPCPFPSARGSQVLIRELAESLARRGHEVHVVTYAVGEHLVPLRGIIVHRAGARFVARVSWLPWLVKKALSDLALAWALWRLAKAMRFDVIHAHNYEGPVVAWLARWVTGCPVVYHAHNVLADELPTYFKRAPARWLVRQLGKLLDRAVPRLADRVVALTVAQSRALQSAGLDARRVAVLPPPMPAPSELGGRAEPPLDWSGRRVTIAYSGNFDAYQELEVLLRGFCIFRQWHPEALLLLVTHEQDWRQRASWLLLSLVQQNAAQVVVCRSFAETRPWLIGADVLVCPRSSWSGYPIKLLNYFALAKPVVLASGAAEGIGWTYADTVFASGQEASLANVLLGLARDPKRRSAAMQAARMFAARLVDKHTVAAELEKLLQSSVVERHLQREALKNRRAYLGVDTHVATSYKPADDAREDEARA